MDLKYYFKKKTNYPSLVIPEKALALIEQLDNELVATSNKLSVNHFDLIHLELSLLDQHRSTNAILKYAKTLIKNPYYYIPRSIAFTIDQAGNHNLYIGMYKDVPGQTNNISVSMFNDLLLRTNNARNKNETPSI